MLTQRKFCAAFPGISGAEVIHCVLDVMYAKAPYTVLRRAMHIHPTVALEVTVSITEASITRT